MSAQIGIDDQIQTNFRESIRKRITPTTSFKELFAFVVGELEGIQKQMSDPNQKSIILDGKELIDKNSPGSQFLIQNYMSKLENIQSLAMDILKKQISMDDAIGKMIST